MLDESHTFEVKISGWVGTRIYRPEQSNRESRRYFRGDGWVGTRIYRLEQPEFEFRRYFFGGERREREFTA